MAAGSVVSRSNVRLVLDFNRVFNLTCFIGVGNNHELRSWTCRPRHCRHVSSTTKGIHDPSAAAAPEATPAPGYIDERLRKDTSEKEVRVEYKSGLPQVTVPLPSRRELCRFTLRPITNTVGDFLSMIQHEDKGIDRVAVSTKDGVRIASSNTIESLMEEDFRLIVNDKEFHVQPPSREKISKEEITRLSDVRSLVNQLYEALNVEEHQLVKERELLGRLEELKLSLEPLEKKRQELEVVTVRRTTVLTWVGLGLMSVQFGILARLTWWEYSWDIMEPVTYFVTYGTAMAAYAYFVLTKQEYLLPDVRDREHLLTLHKKARKLGFDLDQYNTLKDEIARTELDLSRLRDPLQIHLPPRHISSLENRTSPLERLKTLISRVRNK